MPAIAFAFAGIRTPAFAVTIGGLLNAVYIIEVVIGLVLASLAVTGFTGLLRSDEEMR